MLNHWRNDDDLAGPLTARELVQAVPAALVLLAFMAATLIAIMSL